MQVTPSSQKIVLSNDETIDQADHLVVLSDAKNSEVPTGIDPIGPSVIVWAGYYTGLNVGLRTASVGKVLPGEDPLTLRLWLIHVGITDPVRGLRAQAADTEGVVSGVTVSWGDGAQEQFALPFEEPVVAHTYAEAGDYQVAVAVSFEPFDPFTNYDPPVPPFFCIADPSDARVFTVS